MRIRLVMKDNTYVGTALVDRIPDMIVHEVSYYVPTGIEWFTETGPCPVFRQADALAVLSSDVEVEMETEASVHTNTDRLQMAFLGGRRSMR